MQRNYPFPQTYPQFSVLSCAGYCEYRVENWRKSRDGNGVMILATAFLRDAAWLTSSLYAWRFQPIWIFSIILLLTWLWFKLTPVLHESLIILPPHGIQFEIHRGLPGLTFFVSRRFIRLKALQDVVIHEGLRGWDVRFYLAAVKFANSGAYVLEVAYENLLPQQHVLLYVYHGIHDQLLRPCDHKAACLNVEKDAGNP